MKLRIKFDILYHKMTITHPNDVKEEILLKQLRLWKFEIKRHCLSGERMKLLEMFSLLLVGEFFLSWFRRIFMICIFYLIMNIISNKAITHCWRFQATFSPINFFEIFLFLPRFCFEEVPYLVSSTYSRCKFL